MIQINLLPIREARRKADARQQLLVMVGAMAATIVAAFMFHQVLKLDIGDSRDRVAALNDRLEQFRPQQAQVENYKTKKAEIERKLEVIERLERSQSGPVHILDQLATRTPDRVWLTELDASAGFLLLTGMSDDNQRVADFLTSLSDSPYFGNVELVETQLKEIDELKLNTFTIQAQIQDPGADDDAPDAPGGIPPMPEQG